MVGERPSLTVVGRYVLASEIARGGMGSVYLGRLEGAVGFSRTVAIKRLHPQFAGDPDFVSMLLDEARLAARVRHTNVVPVLDVEAVAGELFLVMEYVHGLSLARLQRVALETGVGIPLDVACSLVVGALRGLHAAHEARDEHGRPLHIVHRDVSPQNIMVGSDGLARLLDFGVAKATGRIQTTASGQIKGKLAYMAPEQAIGKGVSARTDVYSVSVVLWELLVGRRLFASHDVAPLRRFLMEDRVIPPREENPLVPVELDQIVMRGLQKSSADRFPSAAAMADEIEEHVPLASASKVARFLAATVREDLERAEDLVSEAERQMRGSSDDEQSEAKTTEWAPDMGTRMLPVATVRDSSSGAAWGAVRAGSFARTEIGPGTSLTYASQAELPSVKRGPQLRPLLPWLALVSLFFAGFLTVRWALHSAGDSPRKDPPPLDVRGEREPAATVAPERAPAAEIDEVSTGDEEESKPEAQSDEDAAPDPVPQPRALPPPAPRRTPSAPPPKKTTSADCDPPYRVDSRGVRHLKLECFK